jgi:hypothetical protein
MAITLDRVENSIDLFGPVLTPAVIREDIVVSRWREQLAEG